jgi:hypothetical protein
MSTASETFEHIVRHQSLAELVPFLLQLAPADIVPVRQKLLSLKAELTAGYDVPVAPDRTEVVVPITLPQSEMLYLAGLATYSRKEALGKGFEGQWADKWPSPAAVAQSAFLVVLAHARPDWLTDWLVGLARQADWRQLSAPYWLLHELLNRGLVTYEPWLFAQAAAHLLTTYNEQDTAETQEREYCEQHFLQSLQAEFPRLHRDLLLFFEYDTPAQSAYFYGDKDGETFTWHELLLSLTASGHLHRADILTRCLGALRRDFRRTLLTWFRALFLALKPTFTERLARQQELTELLAHPQPLVVNFALEQLQDLLPEPGFDLAPLLLSAEGLLTRPDLKTGLRTLVTGLARLPYHAAAHTPAIAHLLAGALAHPDAAVQERAAKGLAELLGASKPRLSPAETTATLATLAPQAELLGAAARATLAPWLATPKLPATEPVAYAPQPQFVPDISPATAIVPVADWHELLFLTGQVLQHDEPAGRERWLDGLLRLQEQLPADYATQLQPYVRQALPQLKKASAEEARALLAEPITLPGHDGLLLALLLGWAERFATPRVAAVEVAPHVRTPPLPAVEQQRYLFLETQLCAGGALPLLSTPTHQPYWVAPSALVSRLLAYQAAATPPAAADLAVALARTAHAHPAEAAQALHLLPQLADAGLRELLTWFFGPAGQPMPALAPANSRQPARLAASAAEALPELWAVAARTKAPAATFPTLTASLGYNYPGTAQPLATTCEAVPRENRYPDPTRPGQEAGYRFVELSWRSEATEPAPSPLLLYAPPAGQRQHGSWENNWQLASELPHFIALLPNYPAPLYAHVLRQATWADSLESSERDLLLQALRSLLGPGPALEAAATAVLASGLIHHTPPGRSLAQEVLLQVIAHGRLLPAALGHILGQQLASGLIHHTPPGRSLAQEVLLQVIAHGRLLPAALGHILGQQLASGYAPAARLADNLLVVTKIDGLTDDALCQTLGALLPALPAAPPRSLRLLLDTYASLLARTGRTLPATLRPNLLAWQKTASLRAVVKTLLALPE